MIEDEEISLIAETYHRTVLRWQVDVKSDSEIVATTSEWMWSLGVSVTSSARGYGDAVQ